MSWIEAITGTKYFRQLEVNQLEGLTAVNQEDVNLVYWKRAIDRDVDEFVSLLVAREFTGINAAVTSSSLNDVVLDQMNDMPLFTPGKIKFVRDIITLTTCFMKITESPQVRLILKIVADDACRKFHTDGYHLRLLCTYAGKGTEWIADRYVNRSKLIKGSNEQIIRDFNRVQSLEPFDVAILKGEVRAYPNRKGIVHRSPPIERMGEKRLLLRIDG